MTRSSRGALRLRYFIGCALACCVALVAVALDASARRRGEVRFWPLARAVVRTLGTPDLVLSSSSRWLRHPSQTEPGAPFADSPAALDPDPGGAVIGPPRAVLGSGARDLAIRHRRSGH